MRLVRRDQQPTHVRRVQVPNAANAERRGLRRLPGVNHKPTLLQLLVELIKLPLRVLGEMKRDDEVAEAIRIYHEDTHNMAEGAGAAPLAALIKDNQRHHDKACGVILCGGNIDRDWAATVLAGGTPELR
jgi:hypothetical protein